MPKPTSPSWPLAVVLSASLAAAPAPAATFTVNTTSAAPLPAGACSTPAGPCSLRAAIEAAKANHGGDRIFFALPVSDPGFGSGYWTVERARSEARKFVQPFFEERPHGYPDVDASRLRLRRRLRIVSPIF